MAVQMEEVPEEDLAVLAEEVPEEEAQAEDGKK